MGFRDFTGPDGGRWQAWDVIPQLVERRHGSRRMLRRAITTGERRSGMDRRIMSTRRPVLGDGMGNGWLCFEREGEGEKRRLTPIPGDWQRCREEKLADYCQRAAPVRRNSGVSSAFAADAPGGSVPGHL